MNELSFNLDEEIVLWQERLFRRSLRRQRKLSLLSELVGNTANLQCLEISAGDGAISAGLRALGGSWKSAVQSKSAERSVRIFTQEAVIRVEDGKLPFDDNSFDLVVLVDALINVQDDPAFIRECHRVLKNNGWVIINETRRLMTPAGGLKRLLGVSSVSRGGSRNGYRGSDLFNILKDGFDVPEIITYSNEVLEAPIALGMFCLRKIFPQEYWRLEEKPESSLLYRYRRLLALMGFFYPLLWILSKLEFFPGHQLLVKSRRRHWRPRLQPKLLDGRSIAEATINTKIGTAAPF